MFKINPTWISVKRWFPSSTLDSTNFFSRKLQPPALAAPVEDGMMFWEAHRPPLQSCSVLPETVDVAGLTA